MCLETKLLTGIIQRRLPPASERCLGHNQTGFRPGRGCIDQSVTFGKF